MKKILNFLIQEIKIIRIYFALKRKIKSFKNTKNKPIILFEFNNYAASQIEGYYFISNILKKKIMKLRVFIMVMVLKHHLEEVFPTFLNGKLKSFYH